jgi:hypothetical protein
MVAKFKLNKATKALPGIGLLGSGPAEPEAKTANKTKHDAPKIILDDEGTDKY